MSICCTTITHYMLHDDGRCVTSVWTRSNLQYRVQVLAAFIWRRSRRFSLPIPSAHMSNHSPHSFSPSQFCPTSILFSSILHDKINVSLHQSCTNQRQSVALRLSPSELIDTSVSNYTFNPVMYRYIANSNSLIFISNVRVSLFI